MGIVSRDERPGLTWRSMLALLFSLALVEPMMIYSYLVTGTTLPIQVGWWPWIVVLVWSEISRFMGNPLSKQELFIILSFQWTASLYALFFLQPIQNMYRSYTAEAQALGVTRYVPRWWVPSKEDAGRLMAQRWVYADPSWAAPLAVHVLSLTFNVVATVSVGYLTYIIYVRMQKLEFPLATAQAAAVQTLAEHEPMGMRILMVAALVGVLSNLFTSFVPFFLNTAGGGLGVVAPPSATSQQAFDMTPYLAHIFPGVAFALTLDGPLFASGFLLPIWVSVVQFAGAFTYYGLGTYIITALKLWPADSQFNASWTLPTLVERSQIHFYTSVTLGLSLAATFIPLMVHWRKLANTFANIRSNEGAKGPAIKPLIGAFICASAGSVLLINYLTGFPIWLLVLFTVGGSFFSSFLSASSAGITISGFSITWLPQFMIFSSGWPDRSVWFAPISMYTGGAEMAMAFKQADILEAGHKEYIRTYVMLVVLSVASSIIFVSYLWTISPIPSGAFPTTISVWPVEASNWARQQVWAWSGYIFKPDKIAASFAIGTVVYLISDFVLHKPGILVCFIAGTIPAIGIVGAASQLLGSIIGRLLVRPFLESGQGPLSIVYRAPNLYIGIALGWGMMETIRVLIIVMMRAMWLLPY
jgi:hypothetical protein